MAKIFLRTGNNYDRNTASIASGIACKDPTRAKQSFKEEADINTIVKRFKLTGQLPENVRMPVSTDYTDIMDFQTAMNAIRAGEEAFAAMPSNIRSRFQNDPARFVEFCLDDNNRPEAEKMGLVAPRKPVAPLQPTGQGGDSSPPPAAATSPATTTP